MRKELTNETLVNNRKYLSHYELADKEEFFKEYPFMEKILKDINRWRECAVVLKLKDGTVTEEEGNRYTIVYHTRDHRYYITFAGTYIGGAYDCNYHCPFEDWTRGGDLTDGRGGEELVNEILRDILSVEGRGYNDYN